MITQLLSDETTTVSNDRLAAAVQRLTNVQRWFEVLSTKSRTPAEARARIEDAQAIADVLAHVREQPVEAASAVTAAADLQSRIEAALSRDGKPRGDHMIGAYAAIAVSTLESDDDEHVELAGVYDTASRCIANELAMFDGLAKLMPEVIALLGNRSGDSERVLVTRTPTDTKLNEKEPPQ